MIALRVDIEAATPIYVQIMDQVRAAIQRGALVPDTPLPSVRQLAADLEINPNTVAKAYSRLERDGVIRTRLRRGATVAPAAREKASDTAARSLDEAVDGLVDRGRSLGLGDAEILQALRRRLGSGKGGRS